ncbi:uncharacterized protein LOC109831250 [Asparagus officinalis]|uniref:uncharacterized protein LOC109831250 n=1 Tax=Asparagus officinalis TaxID=4686 RepID=UPI00098E066C|nr:uncharacterized protein LOC109831250 [Asparagus officinalis]
MQCTKRQQGTAVQVVGVYVDDLIITGSNVKDIVQFKEKMKRMFEMSDLGLLSYYHRIEVRQDPNAITISQSGYAMKILEKLKLADCNHCQVPIEPRMKLSKTDASLPVDTFMYRSVVGSLRYLVNTRPDLAYSIGVVSRYMEAPTIAYGSSETDTAVCARYHQSWLRLWKKEGVRNWVDRLQ